MELARAAATCFYLPEWRARAKVIAALVMRDSDPALKRQNADWARSIFLDALAFLTIEWTAIKHRCR